MQANDATQRTQFIAALAILVAWGVAATIRYWGVWGDDLSAIYLAARFVAEGAWATAYAGPDHIIGYGVTPDWDAEIAALGHPGEALNRYVYPPLWAALLAPIAERVGPQDFFNVFHALHAAALVVGAYACLRMIPKGALSPILLALLTVALLETSLATLFTFSLGQPQALVIALCLLALQQAQGGRQNWAGVLLAVAAAIKLAPGLLVLAFAVCGMWVAVRAFAVAGALLLALSVALAGIEAHGLFLFALAELDSVVFLAGINASASSVLWLAAAALDGVDLFGLPATQVLPKPAWIATATTVLALAAIGISLWVVRRVPVRERVWLAGGMLYLVMTLFGGFAWIHYMVLPLLMLPGLAAQFSPRAAMGLILLFGGAQSFVVFHWTSLLGIPAPQILLGVGVSVGLWGVFALVAARHTAGAVAMEPYHRPASQHA